MQKRSLGSPGCTRGVCVKQDYAEALKRYRKAAEQGDLCAREELDHMYYSGKGVKKR